MKTRLMMFAAVIALFILSGCSDSKESYVKDFKKFIEKVEASGSDYTEEDGRKPMRNSKSLQVTAMRSSAPN